MHRTGLVALLCLLAASPAVSQTRHLDYTAPCTTMRLWWEWNPDIGDSVKQLDCSPGIPLRDLVKIVLWKQAISGGPAAPTDSHLVQPCFPDSFMFQGPGHYHLRASNAAGHGCASGVVTIMPGVLTGADPVPADAVLTATLYNVQGRAVAVFPGSVWYEAAGRGWVLDPAMVARGVTRARLPSGVYFLRGATRAGVLKARRVVLVR